MTPESRAALMALMEQPDPPELQHRGHRLTCAGDPRWQRRLKRLLPNTYTQIILHERCDESEAKRVA